MLRYSGNGFSAGAVPGGVAGGKGPDYTRNTKSANSSMRQSSIQVSAVLLNALTLLLFAVSAPASAEDSCDRAIEFMKSDVSQRIGGSVTYLEFRSIENAPFNNANEEVIVGFGNRGLSDRERNINYNILSSPDLLRGFSEKIILGCSKAIKVRYGMAETGGGDGGWYLGTDNQIRREQCVDYPGRDAPDLPWGKTYCW